MGGWKSEEAFVALRYCGILKYGLPNMQGTTYPALLPLPMTTNYTILPSCQAQDRMSLTNVPSNVKQWTV